MGALQTHRDKTRTSASESRVRVARGARRCARAGMRIERNENRARARVASRDSGFDRRARRVMNVTVPRLVQNVKRLFASQRVVIRIVARLSRLTDDDSQRETLVGNSRDAANMKRANPDVLDGK